MRNEYSRFELQPREIPPGVEAVFPSLFNGNKDIMFNAAVRAEKRAQHHNDVKIGCAIIVINKNLDLADPEIYTGENTKLSADMLAWPDRECAEARALLNSFNVPRPGMEQDPRWADKEIIPGSLKEGGVVGAVLTVSQNENTGEADRHGHNVLISCNQCIVNYEALMKLGLVTRNTIIYNALIDENGQELAHVEKILGQILDEFHDPEETEKRNLSTIKDLLRVRDKAVEGFLRKVAPINTEIDAQILKLSTVTLPVGASSEDLQKFTEKLQKASVSLVRERSDRKSEEMPEYVEPIIKALTSAFEEGVPKNRLMEALGLENVQLTTSEHFGDLELESIRTAIKEYLNHVFVVPEKKT